MGSPPLVPVGPASEPCFIRVVAYRSHQVHPASRRENPPAGDDHNSDLAPQPREAIGSEKWGPVVHSRGRRPFATKNEIQNSLSCRAIASSSFASIDSILRLA